MKNLTTRKIILGLLMGLVLAFGVQGIADAVRDPKLTQSASDFFKLRTPNEPFSIRVSLPFDAAENSASSPETVTITFTSGITLEGIFHGESSPVTLTESGGRDAVAADPNAVPPIQAVSAANGNEYTFGTDGETNSTTITIQGRFNNTGSVGEQTVAISSTDWTEGNTSANTYTYYYHVTNSNGDSADIVALTHDTAARFLGFDDNQAATDESGYVVGDFGAADIQIFGGDSSDFNPVLYTPRGSLLMSDTNYKNGEKVSLLSGHISSAFTIHLKKNTSTDMVTAQVRGPDTSIITGVYIYGYPTLEVDAPTGREKGSEENPGKPGEVITNAFTATVKDGSGTRGVPGVPVKFEIPTASENNGELGFGSGNTGTLVNISNQLIFNGNTQITAGTGTTLYVRTNSSGKASVNCRLITGNVPVTVTAVGESDSDAILYTTAASGKQLTALSSRNSLIDADAYDLFVLVTYDGEAVDPGTTPPEATVPATEFNVIFRTSDGNFGATSPNTKTTATPNSDGIAQVRFTPDGSSSNPQVTASLEETNQGVTRAVDTVTFDISDDSGQPAPPPPPPAQQEARLRIDTSGTGTTREVLVEALTAAGTLVPGRLVTLSGTALTASQTVTTGTAETITVPSTPGIYRLTATDLGGVYDSVTVVITVAAPAAPGTLSLQAIGDPAANLQQTVEVTATNAAGTSVGDVSVTLRGTGFITQTVTTGSTGSIRALVTIPSATGSHTLTAEATGYDSASIDLSTTGQQTGGSSQPETRGPAGVADSIEIDGDRRLSGTVNQALRLRTRVVDANDNGVSGVRVTFKILRPGGKGRLSQRGNGLATQVETDRSGYANATLTPLGGDLIVQAKAAGITAPVSFIIGVGESAEEAPSTPSSQRDETPAREISPEVFAGAGQPPLLWVDEGSGGIYALVGTGVGRFLPSVDAVINIAVSGTKLYWTQMTGENAGTINAANLDGTNIKQLVSIKAVPRGIAVDPVAKRLYWTNSHGWIQSSDLQGRARRNVTRDLSDPMGIAVGNGSVYWAQGDGSVRAVNLTGTQTIRTLSTGMDAANGVVIFGTKVYWTEMTGENAGTINSVNLDGTGAKQLVSIKAVPRGIAVDPVAKRLYWTNSHGWIQSSDLEGRARRNVANGLGSPGGIVVDANIKAPTTTSPTKPTTPTTASKEEYDVNGDGSVDNVDAGLVIASLGMPVTQQTRSFDVNGDESITFTDVQLVLNNRDEDAAGAPMLFGMKLTAEQITRIEEQIDLFIATGDRSPEALKTLIYLQQLIATARPDQTQLLANYPNPFNPETWIPYELAADTDVRITIYNAQGVVIRTLQLGQQSAGYYTDRERAAYWDGRNAFGEQVASGVYFYQLETDTMSTLRKMVILK